MALRRTTVMVDEDDLVAVKAAAQREGRPEAELLREAFHLVALRNRRWDEEWDIPVIDIAHPVSEVEVQVAVRDAITAR